MLNVTRSAVLEHSVETVWSVLRDFNSHARWHPHIAESQIEKNIAADTVGCIRKFTTNDGKSLREQLLTLSDLELAYSYCLLDTPVPLFNYVSHVYLAPVTNTDHTYWQWRGQFNTRAGLESEMLSFVSKDIYDAGFQGMKQHLEQSGR